MIFLLVWISANLSTTVKVQLLGIVILAVAGIFAINSPFIVIIEAAVILLLVVWFIAHKDAFRREQVPATLSIFALQIAYYLLFFPFLIAGNAATAFVLCIIPVLTLKFLYPWAFGRKEASDGRVYATIVCIVQVILILLIIWYSLMII